MFYFAFWRRVSRDSLHFLILRFCAHLIFANFMTYDIFFKSYILILVGYVDEHFQHLLQNINEYSLLSIAKVVQYKINYKQIRKNFPPVLLYQTHATFNLYYCIQHNALLLKPLTCIAHIFNV